MLWYMINIDVKIWYDMIIIDECFDNLLFLKFIINILLYNSFEYNEKHLNYYSHKSWINPPII